MESTVIISSILCNALIFCFCVMVLAWAAVAIQSLITERNDEKRKEASEARDLEYHERRMKELDGE